MLRLALSGMLFLLSPAKSLDQDTPVPRALVAKTTQPVFLPEAEVLVGVMRRYSAAQLGELMSISPALAELNQQRFADWHLPFTPQNSRPAAWTFDGDVYDGLSARTLSSADWNWAQRHVAILSGLYGVLRPLDALQPYRLEMGTALPTAAGKDLYAYWGRRIADHLNQCQADEATPVIVNLASQEYFRSVQTQHLRARVIEVVFEDWKTDRYKIISFFAKRARGLMARAAIEGRWSTLRQIKAFNIDGYALDANESEADRLVFRRRLG